MLRHTAKIMQESKEEHDKELKVLVWPPDSPDLNLIENPRDVLEKRVRSKKVQTRNGQGVKGSTRGHLQRSPYYFLLHK